MKKALRVILPLALALVILTCAAWYFLIYDQAFTKELLLDQARRFEASGNYKISAFLYDVAYHQSSEDDDVAIELAQQYLDMNNYTKAEYTLTNAIRTKPTAELYAALSNVFVQQDKLLDAVNLLNGVSDAAIAKELDAMRPKAPVLSPEPGFYSQYIQVEVTADGSRLYTSTDADYPSTGKDGYTEPISLSTGETVIYALSVNEKGLVSPLTVGGYTIEGVVELVNFTDAAMEAVIREAIDANANEPIYTNQLWPVSAITVPADAKSYEDLKFLPRLTKLTVEKGSAGDLSVLAELELLQELDLNGIRLTEEDMNHIAAHGDLTRLSLAGCSLSNIQPLATLTKLKYLDLSSNTVRNLAALSGMTQLEQLYLANNVVNALDVLTQMKKLEVLDISYNAVASLDPLKGLQELTTLLASNNQINSVQPLNGLTALEIVNVSHNNVADISPLSSLSALVELHASHNSLVNMDGLQLLTHMRVLDLSYNQITALPAFYKTCELVRIDMSHNLLMDVGFLADLPWLNSVNVDYNDQIMDLLPLDTCPVLVLVNAYGTNVTEVSFLTEKSIIVNFDPTLEND